MASYKIELLPSAEKELIKLNTQIVKRIYPKIKNLVDEPFPQGYRKLKGDIGYRIRIGDYRVVYDVNESEKLITIYRIRHRKDVYRK